MLSTNKVYCPLICIFCQDLIYEPLTLTCGHTFCEQCIKDEQLSLTTNCPRCEQDLKSTISYVREKSYKKNCFLKQLFERSDIFQMKCQTVLLCHQGQIKYSEGNYQQAIEIYSNIINQFDNDHIALYNRAKAFMAIKQYDQAYYDALRLIALKPLWSKSYSCHSEIEFEMKQNSSALMSSLKALIIDAENQQGKQLLTRHLHAVLNENNDHETVQTIQSKLEQLNTTQLSNNHNNNQTTTVASNDTPLTMCNSTRSLNSCLCLQFNFKSLHIGDFECSICVNLFWFPVTTPCGHVFCRECLIRFVDNNQAQCPICKSSIDEFYAMLIKSNINQTEVIKQMIETYFPTEYNERRQLFEQETIQGLSIPRSSINDVNNTDSIHFEIPIFVCMLALPHCICPLHVFEPRYRLMMRRAIETESRTFGMCTYDEQTGTFADYGTLLYIRNLVYTQDGRSIIDTIGQRRFRVIERGTKDGYCTAKVELIRDHPIEQHEFDDLVQLNRNTYNRIRNWFDHLDLYAKAFIMRQIDEYPSCDELTQESFDGPSWVWILINLLPISELLQYTVLASQSVRIRLQVINDAIDVLSNNQ